MGPIVIRALGHAATHAVVHRYARKSGRTRVQQGWSLFKDPSVPFGSKFVALASGVAITGFLMLCQVPFELILGLIIPFFIDEAAMVLLNGMELVLLPMLIGSLILPGLAKQRVNRAIAIPPIVGEVIDMPPPMLAVD